MIVLALDTALQAAQVALLDGATGKVRAQRSVPMQTGHAEALIPLVEDAMAEAGLRMRDIGRIGAAIGPGSFTGVRIALSAARAYGLALGRPVAGVTTLEAFAAAAADGTTPVVAAIDARRGEVYAQTFDASGRPCPPAAAPAAIPVATLAAALGSGPWRTTGTGAHLLAERAAGLTLAGDLERVPILALARLAARMDAPAAPPAPVYLRPADAKPQNGALARRP